MAKVIKIVTRKRNPLSHIPWPKFSHFTSSGAGAYTHSIYFYQNWLQHYFNDFGTSFWAIKITLEASWDLKVTKVSTLLISYFSMEFLISC